MVKSYDDDDDDDHDYDDDHDDHEERDNDERGDVTQKFNYKTCHLPSSPLKRRPVRTVYLASQFEGNDCG